MTESLLRSLQDRYSSGTLRPNELDNSGVSLIHQAAADGQLTCLKWLLKHGGDLNTKSRDGSVPAHYAASGGHLQLLQFFYDRQKENIVTKSSTGETPLHVAAQEGRLDCLIWLAKTSPNSVNSKTDDGRTSAHIAAQEGQLECLRYLLKAVHAEPMVADHYGCTLVHYASAEGHWKITKWLIEHCEVNGEVQDNSGCTALHYSAKSGHGKVVETLISCGVSPNIIDRHGQTALDYAIKHNNKQCANVLKLITQSSYLDSQRHQKKVRFNEQVYYDHTLNKGRNTFGKGRRKDKQDVFMDDDFQIQFDHWSNSPKIKRKRERKKIRTFYKDRPESLSRENFNNSEAKKEKDLSLDPPDILKNLTDPSSNLIFNDHRLVHISLPKEPPAVPIRNGMPKLPKQSPKISRSAGDYKNSGQTTAKDATDSRLDLHSPLDQYDFEFRSPSLKPLKTNSPRQPPEGKSNTNSPVSNYSYNVVIPPEVPIRQNGFKKIVVYQVVDENNKVTQNESSHKKQESNTLVAPSHELSTRSPMLNPRYKSMVKKNDDERPSKDATQYIPKSYLNKKSKYNTNIIDYGDKKMSTALHSRWLQHPSFTNHIWELDMGVTAKQTKVDFFSNNLQNNGKGEKGSTWSAIRQGLSMLKTAFGHKKMDKANTWSAGQTFREDIFSRFSIPYKSKRSEFDDLFNSSAEGIYIPFTGNRVFITTPQHDGRRKASSKSGSNATRFKTGAIDNSLKGRNLFLTDIETATTPHPSTTPYVKLKKPKEGVNAIIW